MAQQPKNQNPNQENQNPNSIGGSQTIKTTQKKPSTQVNSGRQQISNDSQNPEEKEMNY